MSCGITGSGYLQIQGCPPNPNKIRAVVFRNNNLNVVYGANTEISIPLNDFFVPVENATKVEFELPHRISASVPYDIYKLYSSNYTSFFKFMALFASYCPDAASSQQYIEWTTIDAIQNGTLQAVDPIGASSTNHLQVTSMVSVLTLASSAANPFTGKPQIYLTTLGGLVRFDRDNGTEMRMWNTFNSNLPTDSLYAASLDNYGTYSAGMWIATNKGLIHYDPVSDAFMSQYSTANSDILADDLNDVKTLYGTSLVAVASSEGVSLWDTVGLTWTNFTQYNTPSFFNSNATFLEYNQSSKILGVGTTSGLFRYDLTSKTWDVLNSSTSPGWTSSDSILCSKTLTSGATTATFIGTPDGMNIVLNDTVVSRVNTDNSVLLSNTVTSLDVILADVGDAYVGAVGQSSGFSVFFVDGIGNTAHSIGASVSSYFNDTIVSVMGVAAHNGSTAPEGAFYLGNAQGLGGYDIATNVFHPLPQSTDYTNLLSVFPSPSQLFSVDQQIFLQFSKPVGGTTFENFVTVKSNIDGSGADVAGTWSWSNFDRTAIFTPTDPLARAWGYQITVSRGITAADGSYVKEAYKGYFYTEDYVPELGWQPIGKLLALSGADGRLTQGIYLRNPQSFDVDITVLFAT